MASWFHKAELGVLEIQKSIKTNPWEVGCQVLEGVAFKLLLMIRGHSKKLLLRGRPNCRPGLQ